MTDDTFRLSPKSKPEPTAQTCHSPKSSSKPIFPSSNATVFPPPLLRTPSTRCKKLSRQDEDSWYNSKGIERSASSLLALMSQVHHRIDLLRLYYVFPDAWPLF